MSSSLRSDLSPHLLQDFGAHLREGGDSGVHLVHWPLQCGARAQSDAITAAFHFRPRDVASGSGVIERSKIMFVYFLSGFCLKIEMWGVSSQGGWRSEEPGPSLKSDTRLMSALTVNLWASQAQLISLEMSPPLPTLLLFWTKILPPRCYTTMVLSQALLNSSLFQLSGSCIFRSTFKYFCRKRINKWAVAFKLPNFSSITFLTSRLKYL